MADEIETVKGWNIDETEGDWIKEVAEKNKKEREGKQLTPGQKAARTKKLKAAAAKALKRRRINKAFVKVRASEAASKEAFKTHCLTNGWKVAFFEGANGAPRNGIIDAIAFRLTKSNCDALDVRLVQLKSGTFGVATLQRLLQLLWIAQKHDAFGRPRNGEHVGQ
jgi:hypothetical protein